MAGFGEMKFAPLRGMDDFATDQARFQIPPWKDMNRWSNRILANLIYYQTNYFVLILAIFLIVGVIHPKEFLIGFASVLVVFLVFAFATNRSPDAVQFKKKYPVVGLIVIGAAGYFLVSVLGSVVEFAFGIALPMLIMFIHASTRLQSLKNRVANKMEAAGFKKTPMGEILAIMGIEIELINFNLQQ